MSGYVIRRATVAERGRVLDEGLRWELEQARDSSGCWVAAMARFPAVLGWICWRRVSEKTDPDGVARVWAGFTAPSHRAALFDPLMAQLEMELRESGVRRIAWARWTTETGEEADWLTSKGFLVESRVLDLSLNFWDYRDLLTRWVARFETRKRQRADVEYRALESRWVPEVRQVVHREGLLGAPMLDRLLVGVEAGKRERLDYELSTVAVSAEGEMVGLLVVSWRDEGPEVHIPARWIAPKYRSTSVYPLMTHRSTVAIAERQPPAGTRVRFEADPDRHPETVHFCRRRGGETVGAWVQWGKTIG